MGGRERKGARGVTFQKKVKVCKIELKGLVVQVD